MTRYVIFITKIIDTTPWKMYELRNNDFIDDQGDSRRFMRYPSTRMKSNTLVIKDPTVEKLHE